MRCDIIPNYPVSLQPLTMTDLYYVAMRLRKKSVIVRFMQKLNIPDSTVDAIFKKKDDIQMGVYETLKGWRKEQTDPRWAYLKLWNALCDADLYSVAYALYSVTDAFNSTVRRWCLAEDLHSATKKVLEYPPIFECNKIMRCDIISNYPVSLQSLTVADLYYVALTLSLKQVSPGSLLLL